ncbi:hypothetical protein [Argonema galeatum]|uniref:hypothetical protein n=1 Tax=Argonema galeatum TaxID=2942762 RepID=UPI00201280E8|nr:hypothetical protein [Argonema galeatum]MCL1466032.1 hypothetical protein [Argonema galeatum A003/A1]
MRWLTAVLLSYAVLGFFSALSALALALSSTFSWAWAWAYAWAYAWTFASTFAGSSALSWAEEELLNSFSKFHTFLILLGTSWLGLGLGWLVYQIFPIFR